MNKEIVILIAEDDEGHATLIQKNLMRAGIKNNFVHFVNGQEVLDYFFNEHNPHYENGNAYLLLLDIRMPKVDGIEVLRKIKADKKLQKMPVIIITTTDDPREVQLCHELGCNSYITKPIDYEKFVEAIRQLGLFLTVVKIPIINGEE